jgi:predicted enzyme related to lactoylglutathione lyase
MGGLGRVNGLVVDGADTHALAAFWSAILGTTIDSAEGDGHYIDLAPTDGFPILRFQRVPESKSVKNRLHLDIEVEDVGVAIETVRALGGSLVRPPEVEYGWTFAILADPEGNEFCAIRRNET